MLKHNLLTIYRNIKRNKSSFLINLIGLSTGLACALLIYLWISDELNVDKFHEKDSQLYQVMQNFELANGTVTWDYTPALLRDALLDEMPEVEAAISVNSTYTCPNGMLSNGDHHIKANGKYADYNFFKIFSYKLIRGDGKHVLNDQNAIVLSEPLAKKLFHTIEHIIGKTIKGNQDLYDATFHVTGIFENPPSSSTDQFDFILNYELLTANQPWTLRWECDPAETYLILKEGTNINHFNEKIAAFLRSKTPIREPSTLFLQQYSKRYLYNHYENGKQLGGRIDYVRLFGVVAIFILIIACINFMNLSTAQASNRMKEIGVRKVLGSSEFGIIYLLTNDFTRIVLTAIVISLPVSYFITKHWLNSFAYRIDLQIWYFVVAGLITLFIAWITVGTQAVKAALINPVESLKYE